MRTFFLLLCLFPLSAKSQIINIVGKWKVIAINNGNYYSYKDSASGIKQFLISLTGKKDSAESANSFLNTISYYQDYTVTFNENGTYLEKKEKKTDELGPMYSSGKYEVNAGHQYIIISTDKNELYYRIREFSNFEMKLQLLGEGLLSYGQLSDIILTLEKSK